MQLMQFSRMHMKRTSPEAGCWHGAKTQQEKTNQMQRGRRKTMTALGFWPANGKLYVPVV
jgi:hypothetical protein